MTIRISRRGSIAVVDDDPIDRMIITRVLGLSHLENPVEDFSGAEEFFDRLGWPEPIDAPALVLMDINMPGMTGFEALSQIRSGPEPPALPVVVMLSSSEARGDIDEATRLGASGYLVKQAGIEEFVSLVNSTLIPEDA